MTIDFGVSLMIGSVEWDGKRKDGLDLGMGEGKGSRCKRGVERQDDAKSGDWVIGV